MLTQTILNNRHILMAISWCIMSLPLNADIICPYICPYEHLPTGSALIETLEKIITTYRKIRGVYSFLTRSHRAKAVRR